LLIANAIGLRVPHTFVVSRSLSPFVFGRPTLTAEPWIRTSPANQTPGLFTTQRGWIDPFKLLHNEDPGHDKIAAVLRQDGVDATYSGAAITQANGELLIEGKSGEGDTFMVGQSKPTELPDYVQAFQRLGPVRFEWVHDGNSIWVVQLHKGGSASQGNVIYPGEAKKFHNYYVSKGLEGLRALIEKVKATNEGVILRGSVGITSHFGDILRKSKIPSRLEKV